MKKPTLRHALGFALVLLACGSIYMSWGALYEFAIAAGFPHERAVVFPAILDVVVVVAMLIALTSPHGKAYAWVTMSLFGGFTIAGNALHVTTLPASVVQLPLYVAVIASSIPALALLLTTHLAAVTVFRPQMTTYDHDDHKRPTVRIMAAEGVPVSEIARSTGVPRTTAARWIAQAN
jgi:hypothetical protein